MLGSVFAPEAIPLSFLPVPWFGWLAVIVLFSPRLAWGSGPDGAPKPLAALGKGLNGASHALETVFKGLNGASKPLETVSKGLEAPCRAAAGPCGDEETGCFGAPRPFPGLFSPLNPLLMASRKLIANFDNNAKMAIGPLAQNCVTNTADNPRYPAAKPQLDALRDALAPYQEAASIQHPTPTQTAELTQLRTALNQALSAVALMANGLYPDDEAALLSTGLALSKAPERHTALEAPTRFLLSDGPQTGTVYAEFTRAPYSVATKVLHTTNATLPVNEWRVVVTTKGKVTLPGLARRDEVWAKAAAVGGDTDEQPYTDVLTRVVQ